MNPEAIEHHAIRVLIGWGVIIAAAWLAGSLCRWIKQPRPVGEIAAGLLLGPSFLGLLWPEAIGFLFPAEIGTSLSLLAKVGLLLMLFQVGMEFDFSHIRQKSRTVVAASLMGIIAPLLCGLAAGPWLHRHFAPGLPYYGFQIFVCVALAITALPVMGRILLEMRLERSALGVAAISAAAIDDVIGWIFLGAATALVQQGESFSWLPFLRQTGWIVLYLLVLFRVVGPLVIRAWRAQCRRWETETFTPGFLVLILGVMFASALVTAQVGIFTIFGAFAFGVALHSEESLVKAWRDRFGDFVVVALVPIFFTYTGLNTRITAFDSGLAWLGCAVVCVTAVLAKLGGCALGARWGGASWRESLCLGALMNSRGMMGLVAINVGKDLGLLNERLFAMFVIMCLVTTAATGPLLHAWLPEAEKRLVPR